MAIKWSPLKYGFSQAEVGAFSLAAGWNDGAYMAEVEALGIRVNGLPDLDAAKSRAEAELRKALKGALALLGDDAPKGGG